MQIDHFFKEEAMAHLNVILSCSESIEETREMGKTIIRSVKDKLEQTNCANQFPEAVASIEQLAQSTSSNIVDDLDQVIQIIESMVGKLQIN